MEKLKHILHALWQFISYLFVPQWGRNRQEDRNKQEERNKQEQKADQSLD